MLKKIGLIMLALIFAACAVFIFGPREPIDQTIVFDAHTLPADLDGYLKKNEGTIANLKEGAEKQIIWNDPRTKYRTPISLIYLHGFSATLEETRPMTDIIAQRLGANVYYARLKGHGRDGQAMAEPTANDWFNDIAEALAIGRAIGDEVVIISTSTGSTLSAWALTKPQLQKRVKGIVMLSPNFGLNNSLARILTWGAARSWVPVLFGAQRSFETSNDAHAKWWTSSYPTVSLLPMAASVEFVNELDFANVTVPALFILHPNDKVVRSDISYELAKRWGKNNGDLSEIFQVLSAEDEHNHVIAGRILSPSNSRPLANKAVSWINEL